MSFRTRLLVTALATLAVGLGALLVIGNVLLASGVRSEASALLQARAEAQMAALNVTGGSVAPATREPANDEALDRLSWVLDGRRVVERPADASAALDAEAVALGRAGKGGGARRAGRHPAAGGARRGRRLAGARPAPSSSASRWRRSSASRARSCSGRSWSPCSSCSPAGWRSGRRSTARCGPWRR